MLAVHVAGKARAHGKSAEEAEEPCISAFRRETEHMAEKSGEWAHQLRNNVGADQYVGQDHKWKKRRKYCVEPQVQAGKGICQNFLRKQQHIEKKYGNHKIYSCFFHENRPLMILVLYICR